MNKEQRPESFEVGTYCATLQKHLSMVPELEPGLKLMAKDLEYTTSVYTDYASLINYTAYLSEPERKTVKDAKSFMVQTKGSFGTASQLSVDELFDELGDHTDILAVLAVNANDVSGPYFEPAIDELAKRMEGGHRLKAEGKQPSDGDPESQKVIWGHTMISDPKALVNFIICHHLERFIATGLTAQGYEVAAQKDFLLNALIDTILLDQLRAKKFDHIYSMWRLPKKQGGLGWITQDRQRSYGL